MKKQLSYSEFNAILVRAFVNYYSLLYSNAMLSQHLKLIDEGHCRVSKDYSIIDNESNPIGEFLMLKKEMTLNLMVDYGKLFGYNKEQSIDDVMNFNAHFLRARVINIYYEVITSYIKSRDKDELNQYFHTYNWFQILHTIRNFSSHGDGLNYNVRFPDTKNKRGIPPYPDTIKWGNFEIQNGQTDPILYSDFDVIKLVRYIAKFFEENPQFH
ncbi:MAG TPA: hypothetical protein VHE59_10885 [Mucilaginibacter sp.]|nr:hypothetical protein [Mucilaginibacter sp.]